MESGATTRAFENVRNQIGCCGIWCGSCVVGNGTLRELAGDFEKLLQGYDVLKWGAEGVDAREFLKGLRSIRAIPVCPGCAKGGGRPECELRTCAQDNVVYDCSECDAPSRCAHADLLGHMREGAVKAGLFVKSPRGERAGSIDAWTAELKSRFPCSILFTETHGTTKQ